MSILILVQDYPSNENKYAMNYVHTRNLEYIKNNIEFTLLSFSAKNSYEYDGIKVTSLCEFNETLVGKKFDLLISHAPNLRNHMKFILKNQSNIHKILMFIHGHEVMRLSKYYPKPFKFTNSNLIREFTQEVYDLLKLNLLHVTFNNLLRKDKLYFIFVSNWMKDVFLENIPLNEGLLNEHSYVVPNSMNSVFLSSYYKLSSEVKADFVTVRPLDNPKYGVDLVVKLAEKHPDLTFHIYGRGEYFNHFQKPTNVEVFNQFFSPEELTELFQQYRCALLPTRLDAQGVMMCEVATYGMPLVTSDLPICKEMLHPFKNVFFFNNTSLDIDLNSVLSSISNLGSLNEKEVFSNANTIEKEMDVINRLIRKH